MTDKIVVDRIPVEDNVLLEYVPEGYTVLGAFKNIEEAKKWIKKNQEKVKELIKKYRRPLYLTSIRTCYIVDLEGEVP